MSAKNLAFPKLMFIELLWGVFLLFLLEAKSAFTVNIKKTHEDILHIRCRQSSENFIYTFTKMQICKLVLQGFIQQTK